MGECRAGPDADEGFEVRWWRDLCSPSAMEGFASVAESTISSMLFEVGTAVMVLELLEIRR